MSTPPFAVPRRVTIPVLLAAALVGCTDGPASGPDAHQLSGVYTLTDWFYTLYSDTFDISDDSYVRLEFLDDEHVRGEGIIWLKVPVRNEQGDVVTGKEPVLWRLGEDGIRPVRFEGWYYVKRSSEGDTLRFRFAREAGGGTLIENLSWVLSEDWNSYKIDVGGWPARLRMIHTVR